MALVGDHDFRNSARVKNLPMAIANGQPTTLEQIVQFLPQLQPIPTEITTAVSAGFPLLSSTLRDRIAVSVRYTSILTGYTGSQVVALLTRPGNLIFDYLARDNQFQDAAGTTPVTADTQVVRLVKPWLGTNNLVADAAKGALIANATLGAEWTLANPAVMNLSTQVTGSLFTVSAVQIYSAGGFFPFLFGDSNSSPYHPPILADTPNQTLLSSQYATVVAGGLFWIQNIATPNAERAQSTDPYVFSCQSSAIVSISSIAEDRTYFGVALGSFSKRTYFGRRRFDLISTETFTSLERNALNLFAMHYSGLATGATGAGVIQGPPGVAGPAPDLGSPGPIGAITPNTAKFTFASSSKTLGATTLADGTTISRATHIGSIWPVNGGTINLPLDANWQVGDEVGFLTSGTNATTFSGNGATLKVGILGTATSWTTLGVDGQQTFFKKVAANSVIVYSAYQSFSSLIDGVIASPTADDALQWDEGTAKWENTPAPFSIAETINRALIGPSSGTILTEINITTTRVGTVATPQPSPTSVYTRANRFTIVSGAVAGNLASIRVTTLKLWRGNAAGLGGFKILIPFGGATLIAGMRAFIGISAANVAATNVDVFADTTFGKIGVAYNPATTSWTLIHNIAGTIPTQVALSAANFPADITTWFEMILECVPNAAGIKYTIRNKTTGISASGELTTNIPNNTTYMHFYPWACNNATASAVALAFGTIKINWRD